MKKVLSLVLAAMMVLAMGVTAFAATDDYATDPLYPYGWDGAMAGASLANTDFKLLTDATTNSASIEPNAANSKAFVYLNTATGTLGDAFAAATAAKEANVEGVKLTAKVTEGKEYVSSIALATADEYADALPDDQYGILIKFKDYFDISKATVKVELTVKSKRGSTLMEKTTVTIKLDNKTPVATIWAEGNTADPPTVNIGSKTGTALTTNVTNFKYSNQNKDFAIKDLVKFQKGIDTDSKGQNSIAGVDFKDIEFFELNADLFSYSVKMSEQGKMSLDFDQKVNKPIARAVDPDVELTFFNFNARPSFDFTGTAEIYLPDEDVEYYLYEITEDGNLASVRGAKLNEDGDAITFKTRTLGCYVLSDAPLELDVDEPSTDVDAPSTDKENPGTGAAVVAVAAAL